MHKHMVFVLLAAMLLALAAPCLGEAQIGPDEDKAQSKGEPTIEEVHSLARWAVILSSLSLIGVLWVGWSLRDIAKNQVQLGKLIQGQSPPTEE